MSSDAHRNGIRRLLPRRNGSRNSAEFTFVTDPPASTGRSESTPRRREGSRLSFSEFVKSRSRSLSRSGRQEKRNSSVEVPPTPDDSRVHQSRNSSSGQPREPQLSQNGATAHSTTPQSRYPSVPPRASSLGTRPQQKGNQRSNAAMFDTPLPQAECETTAWYELTPRRQPMPATSRCTPQSDDSDGHRYVTPGQLTRKPDVDDLRSILGAEDYTTHNGSRKNSHQDHGRVLRSSFDKPLPETPHMYQENRAYKNAARHTARPDFAIESELGHERGYLIKNSETPIDPFSVLDLRNTEATHEYINWAPAVTKETRTINSHEIKQQAITREIHQHHFYHRVLPVVDVEVLPPRHFVPTEDGDYREISEAEIPGGGNTDKLQQLINEAVAMLMPENQEPTGAAAKMFEERDGEHREYTTPEGIKTTEEWHYHPAIVDKESQATSQAQQVHVNPWISENVKSRRADTEREIPNFSRKPYPRSGRDSTTPHSQLTPTHTVLPIRMLYRNTPEQGRE